MFLFFNSVAFVQFCMHICHTFIIIAVCYLFCVSVFVFVASDLCCLVFCCLVCCLLVDWWFDVL